MPYAPGIQFDPAGSARAGQAMVSPLEEALQKYENERKKSQFNQGVFDIMKDKTDSSGKPYIPVEAIARWDSLNPDKQAGYLSAAGASVKEDAERRREQERMAMQWKIASMRDALKPHDTDAADDWKKLNADAKAISGAGIGDWMGAANPRIENGMMTADLPGVPAPPGTPPAAAPFLSKPGKKLQMRTQEYDSLLRRYTQLSQRSGPAAPAAPGAPAPTAPTAPTASASASVGGYIPGRRYAGKTFKGGDPNDPANWQ